MSNLMESFDELQTRHKQEIVEWTIKTNIQQSLPESCPLPYMVFVKPPHNLYGTVASITWHVGPKKEQSLKAFDILAMFDSNTSHQQTVVVYTGNSTRIVPSWEEKLPGEKRCFEELSFCPVYLVCTKHDVSLHCYVNTAAGKLELIVRFNGVGWKGFVRETDNRHSPNELFSKITCARALSFSPGRLVMFWKSIEDCKAAFVSHTY